MNLQVAGLKNATTATTRWRNPCRRPKGFEAFASSRGRHGSEHHAKTCGDRPPRSAAFQPRCSHDATAHPRICRKEKRREWNGAAPLASAGSPPAPAAPPGSVASHRAASAAATSPKCASPPCLPPANDAPVRVNQQSRFRSVMFPPLCGCGCGLGGALAATWGLGDDFWSGRSHRNLSKRVN